MEDVSEDLLMSDCLKRCLTNKESTFYDICTWVIDIRCCLIKDSLIESPQGVLIDLISLVDEQKILKNQDQMLLEVELDLC